MVLIATLWPMPWHLCALPSRDTPCLVAPTTVLAAICAHYGQSADGKAAGENWVAYLLALFVALITLPIEVR